MKKDPKVFFVIDGKREDDPDNVFFEVLTQRIVKALKEYFENNYDELSDIVEEHSKKI